MRDMAMLDDRGRVPGLTYSIDFRPTGACCNLLLEPECAVRAEAGAMVAMSPEIELTAGMDGGLVNALKRSAAGRSASVSTFTAHGSRGRLLLAPPGPGDLVAVALQDSSYDIAGHSYLATSTEVAIETRWGGAKAFFASDNALVVRASGTGVVFLGACGALLPQRLAPAEKMLVDTGHIVAWESSMHYELRKAATSAWKSLTSREGLVAEFTGPGELLLQSRSLSALADALEPHLTTS